MNTNSLQVHLDLRRNDLDPELFSAALAVQHVRRLIASGGSEYERAGDEDAFQPQHIEAFLVQAIKNAHKTGRFEDEWYRLQLIFPHVKRAWERGQEFFQKDLAHVTGDQEAMEYLSQIDLALDCYAYVSARHSYPDNHALQAWAINGYMLAWRKYFVSEET
jgi:hypothetical protein